MGFNLEAEEVLETATLHLKDAADDLMYADGPLDEDGKPTRLPVEAVVYGPGSREYARAKARQQGANMARLRKGKKDMSEDEVQEDGAAFLSAITLQFNNLEYRGLSGKEQVKAVFANRKLGFIGDQITEFAGSWENFSPGSVKS